MTTVGLLLLGAVVGVLSAMFGIGGGVVLVPALVILFGLSQPEAQGTSLATIPFGAVIAALIYHQSAPLRLPVIGAIAAGIVVGALLGAKLVPQVSEAALRSAFGCLLLYLGLLFVFDLRPSHPIGILLALVTMFVGRVAHWRKSKPTTPPSDEQEYYI